MARRGQDTDYVRFNSHETRTASSDEITIEVAGKHSPWRHQRNLERFFRRAYSYYRGKGVVNLVLSSVFDHLNVLFIVFVALFLAICVDYQALRNRLRDRECGPGIPDDASLTQTDCHGNLPISLRRLEHMSIGEVLFLSLFMLFWCYSLGAWLVKIPQLLEMKRFYREVLNLNTRQLQTASWNLILEKLVVAQREHELCITVKELDQLDITNLITRKTNFLIGLYNKDILDLSVYIPFVGRRTFLPYSLQWNIERSLLSVIFDKENNVLAKVKSRNPNDHRALRNSLVRYFHLFGIWNLLLAPLSLAYRIAVFSFTNSVEFRKGSGHLTTREWTPYARWRLREYCEVEHYFNRRLNKSYEPSVKYLSMFFPESLAILARFSSFVFGGFFIVLFGFIVLYDEDIFLIDFAGGRSITWWLGASGLAVAFARAFIPDENQVFAPQNQLRDVAKHTHYFPMSWRGNEDSLDVRDEFTMLFSFKIFVFLEELLSLFLTPYILFFRLPASAGNIVTYFRTNTIRREGIGDVCSFAVFPFNEPLPAELFEAHSSGLPSPHSEEEKMARRRKPGRGRAGEDLGTPLLRADGGHDNDGDEAPVDAPPDLDSVVKMSQSFFNFQTHHQLWKPDQRGRAFFQSEQGRMLTSLIVEEGEVHPERDFPGAGPVRFPQDRVDYADSVFAEARRATAAFPAAGPDPANEQTILPATAAAAPSAHIEHDALAFQARAQAGSDRAPGGAAPRPDRPQ